MIPLQLTIEGLYSYQRRQTIDFTQLTAAGLFGIFGGVGSGKSSILEAISYVLYGETERMNGRENRAYNMMNLKSSRSYIELDFLNFEDNKFRATREFRRNSKNFEDVRTPSVMLYQWKNDGWEPLESSRVDDIIGLSYANFKRTTIIPQGQFKEFLELGGKDRTTMMMEIFDLQRFDLQQKTASLQSDNRTVLDQLAGELKGFEEVNAEQIATLKTELETFQQVLAEAEKKHQTAQQEFQQYQNIKADFETLIQKRNRWNTLKQKQPYFKQLEEATEVYDGLQRTFSSLLQQRDKTSVACKSKQKERADKETKATHLTTQLHQVQEHVKTLKPEYDQLELMKMKSADLALLLQIKEKTAATATLKERTAKGQKHIKDLEAEKDRKKTELDSVRAAIAQLQEEQLDPAVLLAAQNWFSTQKNLEETYQQIQESQAEGERELQVIIEEFKKLNFNSEEAEVYFQEEHARIDQLKKRLIDRKNELLVQQKLAHFADALHDGAACPLCGSPDHPEILEAKHVDADLLALHTELSGLDQQVINLQELRRQTDRLLEKQKLIQQQLNAEKSKAATTEKQIQQHLENFNWPQFRADDMKGFEQKRKEVLALNEIIKEKTNQLGETQKEFDALCSKMERYAKSLADFRVEEHAAITAGEMLKKQLQQLDWNAFEKVAVEEITAQRTACDEHLKSVSEKYEKLMAQEQSLVPLAATAAAELADAQRRVQELRDESKETHLAIEAALVLEKCSLPEIEQVLKQEMDVTENRKQIQQFRIETEAMQHTVRDLEIKLNGVEFHPEKLQQLEMDLKDCQTELEHARTRCVRHTAEVDRLEKQYNQKIELLKEFEKIQQRDANLRTLSNLFKGSGFVQYAASIYLRQLCDMANVRFHRMTRNQLSLELNDTNDFVVVDYLNEGKRRSVKTLSGGQAFQVSLSLALALAESVSAQAKAKQNFFFIDEGFGTQDAESVHIVFETLSNLQKENRIVGIISHVEELKEKLPVALHITKDTETGSRIEPM